MLQFNSHKHYQNQLTVPMIRTGTNAIVNMPIDVKLVGEKIAAICSVMDA